MSGRKRFTDLQIIDALQKQAGVQAAAARALEAATGRKCSRASLNHRVTHSPKLTKVLEDILNQNLDLAEGHLLKQIQAGNVPAITFYLSTMGKHRGYTRRIETTGPGGGPMQHQVEAKHDFSTMSEEDADAYLAARAAGPESS
jgi:CRP-like cAMP-binding protein